MSSSSDDEEIKETVVTVEVSQSDEWIKLIGFADNGKGHSQKSAMWREGSNRKYKDSDPNLFQSSQMGTKEKNQSKFHKLPKLIALILGFFIKNRKICNALEGLLKKVMNQMVSDNYW